ncbi:MAG: N-glycosyltransferase [Syntrophorhabdus sp. PtaU1.Bin153]|nr:MAG: N-glycosyltransferase [Syntrophorhabdus sp. PtaU1.Bin153]
MNFLNKCTKAVMYAKSYGIMILLRKIAYKVKDAVTSERESLHFNDFLIKAVQTNQSCRCEALDESIFDIIVPVYNGYEYVVDCITSVLANTRNCRLIIINDASTDPRIGPFLDSIQAIPERAIEVFIRHHTKNVGFVGSVNHGYRYVKSHFVILNTDTVLPKGWIQRIMAPIIQNEDIIASVTPFSNSASICSFPVSCENNKPYKDLPLDTLDACFQLYGPTEPEKIPTGVGFCMAINKKVVDLIGLFDEETFGKGYGEENDWCMRAFKAGFQNVMVMNLFVFHKGTVSFTETYKDDSLAKNLAKLSSMHREYLPMVHDFIRKDSIRDVRDALAMLIDANTLGQQRLVAVLDNSFTGGASLYKETLLGCLKNLGCALLDIQYDFSKNILRIHYTSETREDIFALRGHAVEHIDDLLRHFKPDLAFINSLVSWPNPLKLMHLFRQSSIPYAAVLHDYFYICPNWLLVDATGKFCRIPTDINNCLNCLRSDKVAGFTHFGPDERGDITLWRGTTSAFLREAASVICFSESSKGYFVHALGDIPALSVAEHAVNECFKSSWKLRGMDMDRITNVGIIGAIGTHKGMDVLWELARLSDFKKGRFHLVFIGNTSVVKGGFRSKRKRLTVHGSYELGDLPALLEKHSISIVLIPSIWPETFCFTASEAMALGYPVICFNIGAQAERVKRYECGIVLEEISASAILKALLDLRDFPARVQELSSMTQKYAPPSKEAHFAYVSKILTDISHQDKQGLPDLTLGKWYWENEQKECAS